MNANGNATDETRDWIVRLERRRDGKMYFFDHDGNMNARRSSAMRLTKQDAAQLAHAIVEHHKTMTARAMRYDSPAHNKEAAR